MNRSLMYSFFLLITSFAYALECSQNGTKIYFINGVLTKQNASEKVVNKITSIATNNSKLIDNSKLVINEKVTVAPFYNPSFGIYNDGLELLADRLRVAGVKNPWATLRYLSLGGSDEPFSKKSALTSAFGIVNLASSIAIGEDIDTTINNHLLSVETLQGYDEVLASEIVTTLSKNLKKDKKKIILVAHSQGNAVTNNAVNMLKAKSSEDNKLANKYLGVLHVATPVAGSRSLINRSIKLQNDAVVNNLIVGGMSDPPNYVLSQVSGSNVNFYNPFDFSLEVVRKLFFNKSGDLPNHGMIETYLSDNLKAVPLSNTSATPVSMSTIFTDNLIDVANHLQNNCTYTVFNYSVNNLTVSFDATDANLPYTSGYTYLWDFGDGFTAETNTITTTHTYSQFGEYNVSLIVRLPDGEEKSITKLINLNPIKYQFSGTGKTGLIQFKIDNYLGSATLFKWTFGDGTTETTEQPFVFHTYANRGVMNVEVEFTENKKIQLLKTTVRLYKPEVEYISQPSGFIPKGDDLVYKVNCNIGQMTLKSNDHIRFYVTGPDKDVFTCSGLSLSEGIVLDANQTQHTVRCTPKTLSCPNDFYLNSVLIRVSCSIFEDGQLQVSSDYLGSEGVTVDFSIPGGCY